LRSKNGFAPDAKGFCDRKKALHLMQTGFCDRKKALHLMQTGFCDRKMALHLMQTGFCDRKKALQVVQRVFTIKKRLCRWCKVVLRLPARNYSYAWLLLSPAFNILSAILPAPGVSQ
jgi:hypothetical protein